MASVDHILFDKNKYVKYPKQVFIPQNTHANYTQGKVDFYSDVLLVQNATVRVLGVNEEDQTYTVDLRNCKAKNNRLSGSYETKTIDSEYWYVNQSDCKVISGG